MTERDLRDRFAAEDRWLDRIATAILALAIILGALLFATRCSPAPTPVPPPNPEPVPVVDAGPLDAGALEDQACQAVARVCDASYDECVLQVMRLRRSYYATLADQDLRCWINAGTRTEMAACENGVCP